MKRKKIWLSEKILNSRFWNWVKIIGAILGVLTGILALVNYFTDNMIMDAVFKPTLTIEQTISPEALNKARESNSPIRIEKGITVYPKEKTR